MSIIKATIKDASLLAHLGQQSFLPAHGHSAAPAIIASYIAKKFNEDALKKELQDERNIFHLLYLKEQAAGYSKIIYNVPHPNIQKENVTKLERLYLLPEFYDLHAGAALFKFNLALSQQNQQAGMWLYVWIENHRAIRFYRKNGFQIIGSYDFQISETHSNPNYQMFLEYEDILK